MHVTVLVDIPLYKSETIGKGQVLEVFLHIRGADSEEFVLVTGGKHAASEMYMEDTILYQKDGTDLHSNLYMDKCWLRVDPHHSQDAEFINIGSNDQAIHMLLSDTEFIR